MATIKAGTYRFNDVLTGSNGAHDTSFNEEVQFIITGGLTNNGDSVIINGSRIEGGVDNDIADMWYHLDSSNVDLSEYNLNLPAKFTVYHSDFNGWNPNYRDLWKTITIPNDTEVSAEFYEWFTANAVEQKEISGVWKFKDVLVGELPATDGYATVYINFTTKYMDLVVDCTGFMIEPYGGTTARMDYYLSDTFASMFGTDNATVYYGEWNNVFGEGIKTIDFGTEPQSVSAEFYNWMTANAIPAMATITHNGSTISELFPGQTATLKCKGMKMEDDVVVAVGELPETEIPEPKLQEKTATENGEVLPDEGYEGLSKVTVAVEGSGVPNFPIGDGNTHIWITLGEGRTSPMLGVGVNGTVTVDWGDGTEPDVLTGTSVSTVVWTPAHNYASAGDYVITLTVDGSMRFLGSSNGGTYLLRHNTANDEVNRAYIHAINKAELGNGATLGDFAFYRCDALKSIILIDSETRISNYGFAYCRSLASIVIPAGVTQIVGSAFSNCSSMRYCDFTKHTAVPSLAHTNVFEGASADFEIRVPAALYDEWIAATNWSTYASKIVAV